MNAKKKLIEYLLVIALYLFICIVLYASAASAQPFPYTKATAREIDFNYFEVNITTNVVYTPEQVANFIDNYSEKSKNIIILSAIKIPSGYLVYGSLKDYSIQRNLLFNPWFNASWERRITYNMSNIEYRKVVNMSNGDGIVPYNKSDRWFDHNTGEQLQVFNYTLIGGQTFIHIRGNLNGNTQWDKYVNSTNFYPGIENASLTYNFYDNISQTGTFNTTDKWYINVPAKMAVTVINNEYLELDCQPGCGTGISTIMGGNENLTQFSNIIYTWNPQSSLGIGGSGAKNGDYSVITLDKRASWDRNDNICLTGTDTTSSSNVCSIPTAKIKSEINRTPYYNNFYQNDTLLTNKTTNIYNGQMIPIFTPFSAGTQLYLYSIIAYNRSANATFTPFQTLNFSPLNFTSWSNNRTNDQSLSILAPLNSIIRFNASTSINCDNCSWYVNGVPYANFTLLKDTSLNYSFTTLGNYNINLIAFNNTFSNTSYLNWTVTIFSNVMLDGFVNNTLGSNVNGVQVNLTDSTGSSTITWTQNHLLGNTTNLAPTIEPSSPGTGERVINVTYWANGTDIEVLTFAHAMSVGENAGVFVYIDNVLVAGQSGRPLGGAETAYRELTVTIPRYSSYRINFTNYHHYEWRESPQVSGYYRFPAVNVGNYNITFRQVGYDNTTASLSLTTNTRYNATISPSIDDDTEPMSMALLGFILGLIALALIIKHRKLLRHDGVH